MKEYQLTGTKITSRKDFHQAIAELMEFPDYYGGNLDALFDVLTDIGEPTTLTITDCASLEANLDTYYKSICRVLRAAQRENEYFRCELTEAPTSEQ